MKYFFHFYDQQMLPDYQGAELANDRVAIARGIELARSTANKTAEGKMDLRHRFEIVDENGRQVRTITLADAFRTE